MVPVPVASIRQHGYVVLRAVLDQPAITQLRSAFTDDEVGHTEHIDIDDSTPHADRWRSLELVEPFRTVVVELLGPTFETRVHGRNPRAGGGQQGLHADLPPDRLTDLRAVTALWMLDPFTHDNGATRVVPGTHRLGRAVPRRYAQPRDHHPDEVIVTGDPGDVIVFDSRLWHSGRRNGSTSPRRSVQMTCADTTRG